MRKVIVFNFISLDGYFVDAKGDMSWAHDSDPEFQAFVQDNAKGGGEFLFGRKTYDLMASYWPTEMARTNDPIVAQAMNNQPKVVFSRSMEKAAWSNTKLIKDNVVGEVRKMKKESGPGLVIFGSGTIVSQLAEEDMIDEYQFIVVPIVLGKGRTMFEGVKEKLKLKLTKSRAFRSGSVFLCYEPIRD
ncbi:MAG TPA: dihydrofolate reductase family protein [Candidatus Acidoferrales bacterium]|nr:dihydrofolate reductase family protein [Candidatus Acidoferrales bacterium]